MAQGSAQKPLECARVQIRRQGGRLDRCLNTQAGAERHSHDGQVARIEARPALGEVWRELLGEVLTHGFEALRELGAQRGFAQRVKQELERQQPPLPGFWICRRGYLSKV